MISIVPASRTLWEAVIREGWLRDDKRNWELGFGKGAVGAVTATEEMAKMVQAEDPRQAILGIYDDTKPVGFFSAKHLGEHRRTVKLIPYRIPLEDHLREAIETIFAGPKKSEYPIARIEAELLSVDKETIQVFRHAGFKQEGILRDRFWRDGRRFDTVMLRLLRWQWEPKKEDKVN